MQYLPVATLSSFRRFAIRFERAVGLLLVWERRPIFLQCHFLTDYSVLETSNKLISLFSSPPRTNFAFVPHDSLHDCIRKFVEFYVATKPYPNQGTRASSGISLESLGVV